MSRTQNPRNTESHKVCPKCDELRDRQKEYYTPGSPYCIQCTRIYQNERNRRGSEDQQKFRKGLSLYKFDDPIIIRSATKEIRDVLGATVFRDGVIPGTFVELYLDKVALIYYSTGAIYKVGIDGIVEDITQGEATERAGRQLHIQYQP